MSEETNTELVTKSAVKYGHVSGKERKRDGDGRRLERRRMTGFAPTIISIFELGRDRIPLFPIPSRRFSPRNLMRDWKESMRERSATLFLLEFSMFQKAFGVL